MSRIPADNHPVLTTAYLEGHGWARKKMVPTWMETVDVYPESEHESDIVYVSNEHRLEFWPGDSITMCWRRGSTPIYQGRCKSIEFFEALVKEQTRGK
jgi:hypothetical protein